MSDEEREALQYLQSVEESLALPRCEAGITCYKIRDGIWYLKMFCKECGRDGTVVLCCTDCAMSFHSGRQFITCGTESGGCGWVGSAQGSIVILARMVGDGAKVQVFDKNLNRTPEPVKEDEDWTGEDDDDRPDDGH